MDDQASRWERIHDIFNRAIEMPREQASTFVAAAASGDADIGREVEELLAAHASAGAFMDTPAVDDALRVIGMTDGRLAAGTRVDRYTIVREIGRGGMGVVYLASRDGDQFQQRVALKIIKRGLDSDDVLRRFRVERRILASLDHPNIARLIDGGSTSDGLPYFVMEYVDARPLLEYCDSERLTIRDRIVLFRRICAAVEHAHRNFVVHRDLKPGNIVITAAGEPKLLDFGVAKLLTDSGDADAAVTATLMRVMTPDYASPEQVRGEPATTASDVYSLGVVLYRLLAGRQPYRVDTTVPQQVERIVCQTDPAPPSRTSAADVADARRTTIDRLRRLLTGDLDNIVLKAMRKDAERRYPTVAELSDDLRRYLEELPVSARPDTLSYRVGKFITRHTLGVAAAALIVLSIVAGLVGTLWQARRATLERDRAERRFDDVRQLASYLVFDIHSGLGRVPGSTALQRQVVERSLTYLDALAAEAAQDRQLRLDVAEAYQKLGDVLGNPYAASLGDRKGALEAYQKAATVAASLMHDLPGDQQVRELDASIRLRVGSAEWFAGNQQQSKTLVAAAVADLETLASQSPSTSALVTLARGIEFTGTQQREGGGLSESPDPERIDATYVRALGILQRAAAGAPDDPAIVRELAIAEQNAGMVWGSMNPTRAIEHMERSLAWIDKLPAAERDVIDTRRLRAQLYSNIGWSQGQIGRYDEGIANVGRAIDLFEVLTSLDPLNARDKYQLTGIYRSRGIIRGYAHQAAAAAADFERAVAIHRELSTMDPQNTTYRFLQGELLVRIGNLLASIGQRQTATARASEGLSMLTALAASPDAGLSHQLNACRWLMETAVASLRDPRRAAGFCEAAVQRTDGKDIDAWGGLAYARGEMGDRQGALDAAERALALVPPSPEGKPKSRQRIELEEEVARRRAALRRS